MLLHQSFSRRRVRVCFEICPLTTEFFLGTTCISLGYHPLVFSPVPVPSHLRPWHQNAPLDTNSIIRRKNPEVGFKELERYLIFNIEKRPSQMSKQTEEVILD